MLKEPEALAKPWWGVWSLASAMLSLLITDGGWGGGLGSRHINLREKKKRRLLYFCIFQISGFHNFSRSGTFLTKEILHGIPNV